MPSSLTPTQFALRVTRLRWALLVVWATTTFGTSFFAHDLNVLWLGRPFGFWMAAQGSVLMFLAITVVYALLVNRWEKRAASP